MLYVLNVYICTCAIFLQVVRNEEVIKQKVYVGQSVKLKCGPIDRFVNIPLLFVWEKPLGNVIGTEPVIHLQNVDFRDGGTYTCRVTQKYGDRTEVKTLSTQLLIDRRDNDGGSSAFPIDPPNIMFKGVTSSTVELNEIQYLYANCYVSNWLETNYTVQWTKDQKQINGATSNLFIFPVDVAKHSGSYSCEIRHKSSPEQKYERSLTVTIKKPEIQFEKMSEDRLAIGGKIHRKCAIKPNGQSNSEPFQYVWTKDNAEISNSEILNIDIADASASGKYVCTIKHPRTGKTFSQTFEIKLDGRTPGTSGTYNIVVFTKPMSPEINKEFQLNCQVNPALPNVQYKWRKNGKIVGTGPTFLIQSFQKSDTGGYTCEVSLPSGESLSAAPGSSKDVNIQFRMTTLNKIELEEDGAQMISKSGDKRELHCEIATNSNMRGVNVAWFFKGVPLDESALQQFNIHRSNRLYVSIITLLSVSPLNEGEYRCEVDGKVKKANLIVLEDGRSLVVNPPKLVVAEKEAVEFHCRVTNVPNVINSQLEWSFRSRNNQKYLPNLLSEGRWELINSPITPETSFISIVNAKMQDDGFYICTAPNGQQRTAELVVKPKKDLEDIQLMISPRIVKVREGQQIAIECYSMLKNTNQPMGEPKFTFQRGRSMEQDSRMIQENVGASRTRLFIPGGLKQNDNGMQVECQSGEKVETATIYLESQCPPNFRRCNNGECVAAGKFCDGRVDCADGSDEIQAVCNKCDPLNLKCEDYGGRSPIKNIFLVHWKCDGENDCGNSYDESQCTDEDQRCSGMNFTCADGKIIPRAYRCDKEPDCRDSEDEVDCTLPHVTAIGNNRIQRIRRGSTVTLTCEAKGVPKPLIIWRQNWGCLLDRQRMTVSRQVKDCSTELSSLTINSFQPGDDGVYTCESLSGTNRAFAEDFQLILESM